MKKVVLVIDHKDRDLKGIALVAFWLNAKHGVFPYITNTKNEITCLIKYKPDLILIQHVRHHHQREFLQFAKAQNTAIAISLTEGFPISKELILFSVGRDEYVPCIDLYLPWGSVFDEYINASPLTKGSKTVAVGCPRFDYHTPAYLPLSMTKNEFFRTLNLDKNIPLVLWLTNYNYANHKEGTEGFIKIMKDPKTSDSRIAFIVEPVVRDHQTVYDTMSDYFQRLVESMPEVNFLIKVHPGEREELYRNKFANYSNLRIISGIDIPLSALIAYADIQLNWRCTTSAEAWITDINKPVVSIEPKDIRTDVFKYFSLGSDIISDYSSLRERVSYYLNGGRVSQELVDKRKKFISDYLYKADGCSAQRCADAVYDYIPQTKPCRRSWHNYKILLKYLPRYRFNKKWIAHKKGESHPKYIPKELIHQEMAKLMKLFNRKADYAVEM